MLGARSILALADRSGEQLQALSPTIQVCSGGHVVPAGPLPGRPYGSKAPHYILEFEKGTVWSRGQVPRSSRLIVRIADDGIERDEDFAAQSAQLAQVAGAGLVSGMNGIAADDPESWQWLDAVVDTWQTNGLPWIHLELAEYPPPVTLPALAARYAGKANSLGLSLAELASFGTVDHDPAAVAHRVAQDLGFERVIVHADEWAIAVHRGDPAETRAALMTGNLLASARARHGTPTSQLTLPPDVSYAPDIPSNGPLGAGWSVTSVPAPYTPFPKSTVGLGDTFVAGVLLSGCLLYGA